ncbi:MAG: transposase [Caldisericia bacterium]|nr:transposase [Caldisericia bacterium]
MIIQGSVYLSDVSRANSRQNNVRKDVERYSNTLSKIPALEFFQIQTNSQIKHYKNEAVLILSDGGDFQKPNAQKMENVCKNVDGSNGHKVGKGYPLESLVAFGLESKTLCPLSMHLFSTQAEEYKSDWLEHKKVFNQLKDFVQSSTQDRIVVEDRGCDDEKRFLYFLEKLKCSFVTRIKAGNKSRGLIIKDKDGNEKIFSVQEIAQQVKGISGAEKEWFNKKAKKKLTSKIAFQKVFLPNHKDIPLYAIFVYSEDYAEPLVVLTDLITANVEQAWKHFFYYKKRWEVENFYRAIKQNFGAEKFLVLDYKKIQALAFLLTFVFSLIIKLKNKAKEFLGMMYLYYKDFCKREQRTGKHHLDLLAFLRTNIPANDDEYSYRFWSQFISKHRKKYNKNQLTLLDWRKKW